MKKEKKRRKKKERKRKKERVRKNQKWKTSIFVLVFPSCFFSYIILIYTCFGQMDIDFF